MSIRGVLKFSISLIKIRVNAVDIDKICLSKV